MEICLVNLKRPQIELMNKTERERKARRNTELTFQEYPEIIENPYQELESLLPTKILSGSPFQVNDLFLENIRFL